MESDIKDIQEILEAGRNNIPMLEGEKPFYLHRAVKFIRNHIYNEDLVINWLKEQCNIKDKNFSARFKLHMGYYPKKYILYYRIETAKNFLKKTDLSITQIALILGFSSSSTFCKAFKRETSRTPSKWRMKFDTN